MVTIEAEYLLGFREKDTLTLGDHLKHRHSVDLIGMKRVGISNFLRFFLAHPAVVSTYISKEEKHLFITVDLIDLVEREIFPFWALTLKRIADSVERAEIPPDKKKFIESLFLKTIQTQDNFVAIDSVRQALVTLIDLGIYPTLFLLRFDRIKDAVTPEFFDNLQGLRNATNLKLSYVFTSYRSLDQLSPAVFTRASLSMFCQNMYIKLAESKDSETIFRTYNNRYLLNISEELEKNILELVNGHIQYLQLTLIILHENKSQLPKTREDLVDLLLQDERITLQSEELWESLSPGEQEVLLKIVRGENITDEDKLKGEYLWDTGFVLDKQGKFAVFSYLFEFYLHQILKKNNGNSNTVHFSKKENDLFKLLEKNLDVVCERERIIESVWPEYSEVGVSDWAIDRLVARVRTKLKKQNSKYEIRTIRTRGYQLVKKE